MNNSLPPSSNAAAPAVPIRLGHYELHDCIGRGGMGLVYRARDTKLDREVAIKCLRTELFEAHYIERFKREALLLAKLNHPNIVQIYDFIEEPDQLALVMELVDGQNLQTYLREHIVSIAQRLQWLAQITEGLAVAHDAGIIHRDLKTENILINKRSQAKITDLGIAKSQDFKGTLTDHVAGSYCSMSPEQAMGEAITFKSDLFSLGILAYQLLCGAHPFGDTSNKLQTMQRIISHPPTAPQKYNPDLPAEFIDLLGQLLSKDPHKRPDNTHWVAAQFEKLKALHWQESASGDDTQALTSPLPSAATIGSRTQDHPTFDTHFVAAPAIKVSILEKVKGYVATNQIAVSSAAASFLIIAGIMVWQLQPKPPKYVAVIPPTITSQGLDEKNRSLVTDSVYTAIQQGLLQLPSHRLIPRLEVEDAGTDYANVLTATAANELITADIKCTAENCTLTLNKLIADKNSAPPRPIVETSKTISVFIDNYLALANTTEETLASIYSTEFSNSNRITNNTDYAAFLDVASNYKANGANHNLLIALEDLQTASKLNPAVQSIYNEIALDLYYDTKESMYLQKLEDFIKSNDSKTHTLQYNIIQFYLNIAKKNYTTAEGLISEINKNEKSAALDNELKAYLKMAQKDYLGAIEHYKKSLSFRKTSTLLYYTALAYWYNGNTTQATRYIEDSIALSPLYNRANSLYGAIKLIAGNHDSAKENFLKVLSKQPNDALNNNNLGLCYLLEEDFQEAALWFEKATNLAPQNPLFWLNKADAKNLEGKTAEAKDIYETLIRQLQISKASHPDHLRFAAQAYAHLGAIPKSLNTLQQLERADPLNIETTYTAALVHTLANNTQSAIVNIENTLNQGMGVSWFRLSWFDSLCPEKTFQTLMKNRGAPDRCAPEIR